MEARLESFEIPNPGIIITAKTEEEKAMLRNLWVNQGRIVGYYNHKGGIVELTIAQIGSLI